MPRPPRASLYSTPLAAMTIAALTLWGCGSDNPPPMDGGGGTSADGGAGRGGTGGGSAGRGGTGGSTAGTAGRGGTGGTAGSTAGTGGGTAGRGGTGGTAGSTGGSTAGTGGGTAGSTGGSTAGTGGGTAGSTGGSAAGTGGTGTAGATGGAVAGTTGGSAAGTGGGTAGTGGTTPACTNGTGCVLPGSINGVCANGVCTNCAGMSACTTAYGAMHICLGTGATASCVMGDCQQNSDCNGRLCNTSTHFCTNCTTSTQCVAALGANHVCQNGTCIAGNCLGNSDCQNGQFCGAGSQCTGCGISDATCVSAFGAGYICVSGGCVTGTCHDNSGCASGQICTASHVCAPCTTDGQCGTGRVCVGTGATATCVTGNCHVSNDCSNGQVCLNNTCANCTGDGQCAAGQLCLSGGCVTGNCRLATDCSGGRICTANNCTACATDGQCISGYGANQLCNGAGACVPGNCRAAGDCTATSQVCNTSTMFCAGCAADSQCASEYAGARICISNVCVVGNCHDTTNCPVGQLCGVASHACEGCASDTQCADAANYGPNHICQNNACISGNCHAAADCNNSAQICSNFTCGTCSTDAQCTGAYGANHVCAGGACVSGNCTTSAQCGNNQLCVSNSCVACTSDAACVADTTYGAMHICLGTGSNAQCVPGNCHDTSTECMNGQLCGITTPHTCGGCGSSDTACKSDAAYGSSTICLSNACVTGDCHNTSTDCAAGQICVTANHTCSACGTDTQCTSDARYGTGNICYQGNCQVGNCHAASGDCSGANAGRLCGVTTPLVCGACGSDSQCTSDPFYGTSTICNTTAGANQGRCISAACGTNSTVCAGNTADFCCGNTCVPGNCCNNTDCANNPMFGAGYACTGNSCSRCDAISGNTYYVDPVNGNDVAATGSGLSAGAAVAACSFRTVTRAMQVIGSFAGANTKVIIVGAGTTPRGLAAADLLPITVQPNVTVTTTGGPITIILPAAPNQGNPNVNSGFILSNSGSGVTGDAAAPLIIDGNSNTSGYAISVTGGTSAVSNLTVRNTRAHGINVTGGTLNIGSGLAVTNAGIAGQTRNGINISGGVVNINVPSGQATTSFNANTQHGIEVSALGSVNVTGAAVMPPTGNGTVIVSANLGNAGLHIHQTVAATLPPLNTINGLLAWGNNVDGARIAGGSAVRIRNSVFGANVRYGIVIIQGTGGTTAQERNLAGINLGTGGGTPDYGRNYLQTPTTVLGRNQTTGLCVTIGGAATAPGTLAAAGNFMVFGGGSGTQVDCSTTVQTVTKGPTCQNGASLGIATGTTAAVTLSQCN